MSYQPVSYDEFMQLIGYTPKDYQREGVEWCKKRENSSQEHRGGILADEMGLGKTITMISLMLAQYEKRTLIVLPLALLNQWYDVIHNTLNYRAPMYHGVEKKQYTKELLESCPFVLTTYGEMGSGCSLVNDIEWNRIIYDEAHHLRNAGTRQAKFAHRMKRQITWLITGTPIQNSRKDFFSLCSLLGLEKSFYIKEENIATVRDAYMLRRTKQGVGIKLPALHQETIYTEWKNKSEKYLSQQLHANLPFLQTTSQNDGWSQGISGHHFGYMMRARQMCAYPQLIAPSMKHMDSNGKTHIQQGIQHNSKMNEVLNKIIERKDNKRRKIIFCQFHGEIDAIQEKLQEEKLNVLTVDGRTSDHQRRLAMEGQCDILVLQIQTGCEGLNLQMFSEIYFASPHWNPGIEDQAVARCHRIGQDKEVNVYRFNMKDGEDRTQTIDAYCQEKQTNKRKEADLLV